MHSSAERQTAELTLSQRLRIVALSIYSGIHLVLAHPAAAGTRLRVPGVAEGKGSPKDPETDGECPSSERKWEKALRFLTEERDSSVTTASHSTVDQPGQH